ncbi:complex I subunit 1 family protein [Aurantimonas sp. VKM B-3413]|uniref:complex I subunit 1 family protein n=1 Tax=Aurantimonas sp. VKM B-3413 TaxID=2779401 RepID=UPI001E4E010A|nr:NADH-quinone oxidoreductase subunit H [Aurantimonas sp. VKM B-3413]MCB8840266.1 NADH-quinone oxidoreductase subunit H [Aurantimonas sp. VKM B-3413]
MTTLLAALLLILFLSIGFAGAALADRAVPALLAGRNAPSWRLAVADAARLLTAQRVRTEAPDALLWGLAPALYLALAIIGLAVVPFGPNLVAIPSDVGIVVWGSCEALTIVAVFMFGWSANAPLPLIGAYRYVAIALPGMLLSMFVLIGAALPAESLGFTEIVEAQRTVWNVVRQPAGLILFLMLGLAISLRGPFDYASPQDLAGGVTADVSGPALLAWRIARLTMLVSVSAVTATAFLGGYLGPLLPGFVWLALKTALVLLMLVGAGSVFARLPPARVMGVIWTMLLPLSFLMLLAVGVELLLWA